MCEQETEEHLGSDQLMNEHLVGDQLMERTAGKQPAEE